MRNTVTEDSQVGQFLTVHQLAALTRESEAAWRKRILHRQIQFIKVGRNVRIRAMDFERWIEQRVVPAQGSQK